MTWYAEFHDSESLPVAWTRIGISRKTRERAKADAKAHMIAGAWLYKRGHYRIVADDERGTIEEVSNPPHGWRMRWVTPGGAT